MQNLYLPNKLYSDWRILEFLDFFSFNGTEFGNNIKVLHFMLATDYGRPVPTSSLQ